MERYIDGAEILAPEQSIVRLLRERILRREFAPGERLRQNQISKQFGVSSTPVREAFRILLAEGLLQGEANRGVWVRALDVDQQIELYQLWQVLECENSTFAIANA